MTKRIPSKKRPTKRADSTVYKLQRAMRKRKQLRKQINRGE